MENLIRVLVLCTGNSCRSIMAEALLNHYGKNKILASSAGSQPTGTVHPMSLKTLDKNNIPHPNPQSKSWSNFSRSHLDFVITVCDEAAQETCPVFSGNSKKLHWSIPDPAKALGSPDQISKAFQSTFDELKERINTFLLQELNSDRSQTTFSNNNAETIVKK
jgi:arsenate reductase